MGAALAYYTLFSVAPILVIAMAVAGLVFGRAAVQNDVFGQLQGVIGPEGAAAVEVMLRSAHRPAVGVLASVAALVVLLIGATSVFAELQDALNDIWKVETGFGSGVGEVVKSRLVGGVMVLGMGLLLGASLMLSEGVNAAAKHVSSWLPSPGAGLATATATISWLVITVLFALIFKILPACRIAWSDVWVGSVITALLLILGKFAIGLYIGKTMIASSYGAAGSVVVMLAWTYYAAQIFYIGAELTRVYSVNFGSHLRRKPGADPRPRGPGPAVKSGVRLPESKMPP